MNARTPRPPHVKAFLRELADLCRKYDASMSGYDDGLTITIGRGWSETRDGWDFGPRGWQSHFEKYEVCPDCGPVDMDAAGCCTTCGVVLPDSEKVDGT